MNMGENEEEELARFSPLQPRLCDIVMDFAAKEACQTAEMSGFILMQVRRQAAGVEPIRDMIDLFSAETVRAADSISGVVQQALEILYSLVEKKLADLAKIESYCSEHGNKIGALLTNVVCFLPQILFRNQLKMLWSSPAQCPPVFEFKF